MTQPYNQPFPPQQPGYGQQPGFPPPQQQYGQPQQFGQPQGFPGQQQPMATPPGSYATWEQRAGAYLIDVGPLLAGYLLAFILMFVSLALGIVVMLLSGIGALCWIIPNRWIAGGKTGQSMGRRKMNITLISEQTGQPLGPGGAFLRDLCHAADGITLGVGYLFPLWDVKRQTFADKIMTTVVVTVPPGQQMGQPPFGAPPQQFGQQQPFPPQPGYGQQPGFGQQQPGFPPPQQGFPPQQPGFPPQQPPPGFGGQQQPRQW